MNEQRDRLEDLVCRGASGAIGGAMGTLAMSVLMLGARRWGLVEQLPPEHITKAALDAAGLPRSRRAQDALAILLHFSFGIPVGVLFGLPRRVPRAALPVTLQGAAYGVLVWFVSYMGWLPALGLMPPPTRDYPRRTIVMVAAHLVYGLVLGGVVGRDPSLLPQPDSR